MGLKEKMSAGGASAERDADGREHLAGQKWEKMGTKSYSARAAEYMERITSNVTGGLEGEDLIRVLWLSSTLFFVVGGYWLLRSLKDPIMSAIDGVEYIPQAKIASLFVVFALVIVYNKLLDLLPKHQLFYLMGGAYGAIFTIMGLLLMHPTIGLPNTEANPTRILGWLSYVTIESFGSMVVQCYWALVNASVDVNFAKKNFGLIVAGAQIGSILGPTVATQASVVGIPALYLLGALIMFLMIGAMYFYVKMFGVPAEEKEEEEAPGAPPKKSGKEEGILEGFYLFYEHDYVKGIFAISSLFMVQVTVIDYMMKVLAKDRYAALFPDDPQAAMAGFASFMGYFGQTTNSISFLFSLFGTGLIIKRCGLTWTLILFPVLLLICTICVWLMPNIWVVFSVMMVIKGMSYALNNPTKEILYQMTSTQIKFKCKSWIDTFGQRSAKAGGSLVTNAFATSLVDLNKYVIRLSHLRRPPGPLCILQQLTLFFFFPRHLILLLLSHSYGSAIGVVMSVFLIWISQWMGQQFDDLHAKGEKVGERAKLLSVLSAEQNDGKDTSCLPTDKKLGAEDEGQSEGQSWKDSETKGKVKGEV